jgi:hypothetical protein
MDHRYRVRQTTIDEARCYYIEKEVEPNKWKYMLGSLTNEEAWWYMNYLPELEIESKRQHVIGRILFSLVILTIGLLYLILRHN